MHDREVIAPYGAKTVFCGKATFHEATAMKTNSKWPKEENLEIRTPRRDSNGNKLPLLFVVVASMLFVAWMCLRSHDDSRHIPVTLVDLAEIEVGEITPPSELFFDQTSVTSEGNYVIGLFQARHVPGGTYFLGSSGEERAAWKIVAIAINSYSGDVRAVNIYPPKAPKNKSYDVMAFRSLGSATCAIDLVPYNPDGLEWVVPGSISLEWNLQTGQLSKLETSLIPYPLDQLCRVLEPTSFQVIWPQLDAGRWDGIVEIVDRSVNDGSKGKSSRLDFGGEWDEELYGTTLTESLGRLEIAPGNDDRTIVTVQLSDDRNDLHVIEAVDLDLPGIAKWSISSETIARELNIASSKIEIISGLCRPCEHIPLQVGRGTSSESWLCDLNPADGTIRKIKRFDEWAWRFELACSADGRYVAHCDWPPRGDRQLSILDITNPEDDIVMPIDLRDVYHDDASFWPDYSPLILPLGFNKERSLMLRDGKHVFLLKYPYDGKWQCIFSVAQVGRTISDVRRPRSKK